MRYALCALRYALCAMPSAALRWDKQWTQATQLTQQTGCTFVLLSSSSGSFLQDCFCTTLQWQASYLQLFTVKGVHTGSSYPSCQGFSFGWSAVLSGRLSPGMIILVSPSWESVLFFLYLISAHIIFNSWALLFSSPDWLSSILAESFSKRFLSPYCF